MLDACAVSDEALSPGTYVSSKQVVELEKWDAKRPNDPMVVQHVP